MCVFTVQGLHHEVTRVVQGGVCRKSHRRSTTILTPLHRLVQHSTTGQEDAKLQADAVGALLDAKANPNTADTHYRRTPLMDACWAGCGASVLRQLLDPRAGQF